jgi:poly-gamma-glutamate synthesis protein (capsule biosynthesis protein)
MDRRGFLRSFSHWLLAFASAAIGRVTAETNSSNSPATMSDQTLTLFLCGDVMTGRGIDQVLPHPSDPTIHESYMKSALGYVQLAEDANGPIPKPVDFDYIWGDALEVLEQVSPDLRIINLETSITTSDDYWPQKSILYRMHPGNIPCLTAAGIDCCVLGNNHVMDWGYRGLLETMESLRNAGIQAPGVGLNIDKALEPAIFGTADTGRVLVFSAGSESSGVMPGWAATKRGAGIYRITKFSDSEAYKIGARIRAATQPGDIAVMSLHWGGNWGYEVDESRQAFARLLIDKGGVDVVHGHSSHHVRGVEIYRNRPIIYGCGDFVNDYEGIERYEEFRGDLSLMYFPTLDRRSGELLNLEMTPMRIKRFRIQHASAEEATWLAETLDRESARLGARVGLTPGQKLRVDWDRES